MANTPNKGLYLPSRDDETTDVDTSLATNFTIVDTELKKNEDDLATHKTDPSAHTSEAISHADGSVKTTLDNHESRIDSAENELTDHEVRLDAAETGITTHGLRLDANSTELSDHETRLSEIETLGIDLLAPNLESRLETVESDVEGILAPATLEAMSQQSYTFDEYRIGYVQNALIPINEQMADKASQASLNTTNANVAANTSALGDKATEVYPEKYGAVGDGVADDRVALTNAFAYAMTNKLPVVLKDGKTYLINSIPVSGNVFDITGALKLRGNATIKIGAVGDYDTIFNLKTGSNYSEFLYFTLDENTTGNPKTVNTGASGKRRVAFYSWNGTGNKTSFMRFKGVNLNDCIGVWQITLNSDNVKINRCTINYSSAGTVPAYDRTCVYMAGTNWNVYENTLNGSANAHTCMETHGSNITVFNNKAFNYDNIMYIVNDSAGASSIDNISVIDNNFNCRFGIRLWFQVDNVNVDTVNINNNKITVTGASSAFSTYEVTGNNITVNNVKFTNNVVNLNSQTDSFVQLRNTESATKTGVTYNDFNIENNTFNGVCQYAIKLEVQPQKVQLFHRLNINKNTFNITNLYSDRLLYMIDVPVGFEDVMLFANKFKVLSVTGFTTTRILHGSTASRTSGYGAIKLRQNEYSLPSGITFALANAEGVIFADVKETFDIDISTITATALAYNGMIRDIFNQSILFNNGAVTKRVFYMTAMPTSGTYTQGDIIWNKGTDTTVSFWRRLTTGSGNVLNTDWKAIA